jgi:hypothetical protein
MQYQGDRGISPLHYPDLEGDRENPIALARARAPLHYPDLEGDRGQECLLNSFLLTNKNK